MVRCSDAGVEELKNLLAVEAIKFMELTYNKIPCDYSYVKLQSMQKEIQSAQRVNRSLCQQIEEKDMIIDRPTKGWDGSLDTGYGAKKKLQRIVDTSFSSGSTKADCRLNHALLHVQYVATHLDEPTLMSDDMLQQTKSDPCFLADDESSDVDELGCFQL